MTQRNAATVTTKRDAPAATEGGCLGLAIALPQTVGAGRVDPLSTVTYARRAETLGFDGLWVSELMTAPVLDPLTLLAHCAAVTERIHLGVAVVLTALRVPVQLARETATIDQLSGGRLTVGVGLGSDRTLYASYGLSARGRVSRFEEGIELLKRLWAGEEVIHQGTWQLDGRTTVPLPVQQPHPPVWFGARSTPALRRAVYHGSGWIGAGSEPPDVFAANSRRLAQLLEEAGRDPGDFATAKRIYIAVDDDRPRARERARAWCGASYGKPDLADEIAVLGTPERCAEDLDRIRRSGADLLVLNPMYDEQDQMETIAAEVVPLLSSGRLHDSAETTGVSNKYTAP